MAAECEWLELLLLASCAILGASCGGEVTEMSHETLASCTNRRSQCVGRSPDPTASSSAAEDTMLEQGQEVNSVRCHEEVTSSFDPQISMYGGLWTGKNNSMTAIMHELVAKAANLSMEVQTVAIQYDTAMEQVTYLQNAVDTLLDSEQQNSGVVSSEVRKIDYAGANTPRADFQPQLLMSCLIRLRRSLDHLLTMDIDHLTGSSATC